MTYNDFLEQNQKNKSLPDLIKGTLYSCHEHTCHLATTGHPMDIPIQLVVNDIKNQFGWLTNPELLKSWEGFQTQS